MKPSDSFSIAGETLRSAFHQAEAQHIGVTIHYDAHHLRVIVRDDGRGIEPEVLRMGGKQGHFGLRDARARGSRRWQARRPPGP